MAGQRMILTLEDGLVLQNPGERRCDRWVYLNHSPLRLKRYFHPYSLCRNEKRVEAQGKEYSPRRSGMSEVSIKKS